MKTSEVRDLEAGELAKRVSELRKEVFGLRFSNATGELDNTAGLRRAKRDLARLLTVVRERERRTGTQQSNQGSLKKAN